MNDDSPAAPGPVAGRPESENERLMRLSHDREKFQAAQFERQIRHGATQSAFARMPNATIDEIIAEARKLEAWILGGDRPEVSGQ